MEKVLVVDSRHRIGEALNVQLMVSDMEEDFTIMSFSPENKGELQEFVKGKGFSYALVEHDELDRTCTKQEFGSIPIYGYAKEAKAVASFDRNAIPYMGIAPDAEEMIPIMEAISKGQIPAVGTPAAKPDNSRAATPARPEPPRRKVVEDEEDEEVSASPEDILKGIEAAKNPPPAPVAPVRRDPAHPPVQQPPQNADRPRRDETVKPFQVTAYDETMEQRRPVEMQEEKRTKVISVYSAKGGVGKSTLSANIALYLSMMDHGRDKYRVCLVDYNIESGDVRTLLGFKGDKLVDMGIWAEDIHQMIKRNANPNHITFTRDQIYRYLTPYHDKTGLYVLLAPMLHENAQFIEAEEIQVMLRNIIQNGEFDFVICDTADNTSDSSYCALEASDEVFLVCTQDVTTATRNDSVMRSLKHTGMDMSKFSIIINNVTSKRKAGVSVSEIESYFEGYPCIGRVHESSDVLHANNYASPLVLKPRHAFTEDLKKIVLHILNQKDEDEAPKKGGLFRRK